MGIGLSLPTVKGGTMIGKLDKKNVLDSSKNKDTGNSWGKKKEKWIL